MSSPTAATTSAPVAKDRYKTLTTAAVLVVAVIAAAVSFVHVAELALRYGQPPMAAYLLPVSIDGLVAVASLVMVRAARLGVSAPWLARTGLVLAVLATVACNVAYGLPHGWPGALLSGWPAVSFVVAAEMAIMFVRKQPASVPVAVPVTRKIPSVREIRGRQNCSQQTAEKIRTEVKAALNGSGRE